MLVEPDEIAMAIGNPAVAGIAFFRPNTNTHDKKLIAEVAAIAADISNAVTAPTTTNQQ